MVSDEDELGLLSKARPLTAKPAERSHPNSRWIRLQQKSVLLFLALMLGWKGLGGR